jgi:hypothetical protein
MTDGWREAKRAWDRLAGRPRTGEAALDALVDIGAVRRLLDRTEFDAVRNARRARRSWAEIATGLGVSRQSAWERWRDVDDEPAASVPGASEPDPFPHIVTVPDVCGMSWPVAEHRLQEEHLVAHTFDHNLPFLGPEAADFQVVHQDPVAGERLPAGSPVLLSLHRPPGSAGDRAPLPGEPPPHARRGAVDETTGLSVP